MNAVIANLRAEKGTMPTPRRNSFALAAVALALSCSPAFAEGGGRQDSRELTLDEAIGSHIDVFTALPLAGELAQELKPWSGPYWKSRDGVIAYRWQTKDTPWEYKPPERARVLSMTADEIALLSPAEKFDILRGDYTYPTVKASIDYAEEYSKRKWRGICNGYAQAAAQVIEPIATTFVSEKDGISIPFGSADLKALASFYYEDQRLGWNADFGAASSGRDDHDRATRKIGLKCDLANLVPPAHCRRDLDPRELHVTLANLIGLRGEAVYADTFRGRQVWQHPIFAYRAKIIRERAASPGASGGVTREVHVRLKVWMGHYADADWNPTPVRTKTRTLDYWLGLNAEDRIVGGRYLTIGGGPVIDYLWVTQPLEYRYGYELLAPALRPKPRALPPVGPIRVPSLKK
jgi:hypothetical protein